MNLNSDLEGSHGHLTGDGVPAVRGPVLPGLDGQHDLIVAQHGRDLTRTQTLHVAQQK